LIRTFWVGLNSGMENEHFMLKRNLAKTKENEILMVFFGIHTSNALNIGRRMARKLKMAD
jgi:hypothetical protein